MRRAIKISKPVQAFRLGDQSDMERMLIDEGIIRVMPDGYELLSMEAVNGRGELAAAGDYFKVDVMPDGRRFAYPNRKNWFETHHTHLGGNEYLQINHPLFFWQAGDPVSEEVRWLLDKGKLILNEKNEQRYFNAYLWGAPLSAAKNAALVFYRIQRDDEGITDISFNFIEDSVFRATYEIL